MKIGDIVLIRRFSFQKPLEYIIISINSNTINLLNKYNNLNKITIILNEKREWEISQIVKSNDNKILLLLDTIGIDSRYLKYYKIIFPKKHSLTGMKDIDILILVILKSKDFINIIKVDKYAYNLSKDENLWKKRIDFWYPDAFNFFCLENKKLSNRDNWIRLYKNMKGAQYNGWIDIINYFVSKNNLLNILTIPDIKYLEYLIKEGYFDDDDCDNEYRCKLIKWLMLECKDKDPDKKLVPALKYLWKWDDYRSTYLFRYMIIENFNKFSIDVFEFLIVVHDFRIFYRDLYEKFDKDELLKRVDILLTNNHFVNNDSIYETNIILNEFIDLNSFIDKYNIKLSYDDIDNILFHFFDKDNNFGHDNCSNETLFNFIREKNFIPSQKFIKSDRFKSICDFCKNELEKLIYI